ncbi:hypothetical protein D9M71_824840 [compost metagenome]
MVLTAGMLERIGKGPASASAGISVGGVVIGGEAVQIVKRTEPAIDRNVQHAKLLARLAVHATAGHVLADGHLASR